MSPKLRRPTASPPRTTVKCSHERKVRSFANATLGSTLTGRAMRLAAVRWRRGWVDMAGWWGDDEGRIRREKRRRRARVCAWRGEY